MKKIIAVVLAVIIFGAIALGIKYEDKLFTEKREDAYLEINDEVIYDLH